MINIFDIDQRSEEWDRIRTGIPTASSFDKLIKIDGTESKQKEKYIYRLAGERLSGAKKDSFQSQAMLDGIKKEEEARNYYAMITSKNVKQVGFIFDDELNAGCSPDALIDDDGLLEIKCPMIETHVEYMLNGDLPSEYFQQVQGQLLITQRKWCDFMSYHENMRPLIIRVIPDIDFHNKLLSILKNTNKEIISIMERIK